MMRSCFDQNKQFGWRQYAQSTVPKSAVRETQAAQNAAKCPGEEQSQYTLNLPWPLPWSADWRGQSVSLSLSLSLRGALGI